MLKPHQTKKVLTLCIVHQHPRVLLGMKKRGFGEGRWNGFGGKVEKGESIEEATKRECFEEAGITVRSIEPLGTVHFEFQGNPEILEVHISKAVEFEGDPVESDEMRPQWFEIADIPFGLMWPDDRYWVPLFLKGIKFSGRFLFDEDQRILEHDVHPL